MYRVVLVGQDHWNGFGELYIVENNLITVEPLDWIEAFYKLQSNLTIRR